MMFSACCRRSENAIRLSATGAQRFVVLFSRPVIRYDNFIINAVSIKNLTLEKQLWRRPLKRTGIGEALQLAVARPRIAHLGRRVLLRCRHRLCRLTFFERRDRRAGSCLDTPKSSM
jgi:hypothetical protein